MNRSFPTLPIHSSSEGDILEYVVYPVHSETNLANILNYTLDLISTLADNYIWNLDSFNLTLDSAGTKLDGSMDLGEDSGVCLDEWLVVYVFWQVSKRFNDIVIRYIPASLT
jgi:hypothetical protein